MMDSLPEAFVPFFIGCRVAYDVISLIENGSRIFAMLCDVGRNSRIIYDVRNNPFNFGRRFFPRSCDENIFGARQELGWSYIFA